MTPVILTETRPAGVVVQSSARYFEEAWRGLQELEPLAKLWEETASHGGAAMMTEQDANRLYRFGLHKLQPKLRQEAIKARLNALRRSALRPHYGRDVTDAFAELFDDPGEGEAMAYFEYDGLTGEIFFVAVEIRETGKESWLINGQDAENFLPDMWRIVDSVWDEIVEGRQ